MRLACGWRRSGTTAGCCSSTCEEAGGGWRPAAWCSSSRTPWPARGSRYWRTCGSRARDQRLLATWRFGRLLETVNPGKLETGAVEVVADDDEVLSASEVLLLPVEKETEVGEESRLRYCYLDLRQWPVVAAIRRSATGCWRGGTRTSWPGAGFLEVQTPAPPPRRRRAPGTSWCPAALSGRVLRPPLWRPSSSSSRSHGRRCRTLLSNRPVLSRRSL